jgi:DNA-binding transcriptional LysR family regulator
MSRLRSELDFAALQALSVVGRTASLVEAARVLGVGSPAISKQLTRLETKLGLKLVHRTTHSVSLSPAGLEIAAEFERARELLYQTVDEARSDNITPRGVLRVTAPPVIFKYVLTPIVSDFLTNFPDVSVELDLSLRFVDIASEGFDVALRVADHPPPDCVALDLGGIEWGIYASDTYLQSRGVPELPQDLMAHRYIAAKANRGRSQIELHGQNRLVMLALRPVVTSQNVEVTYQLISSGVGVGALPDFLVRSHKDHTGVHQILSNWTVRREWGAKLFALTLPGRAARPAARAFVQMLRCLLKNVPADKLHKARPLAGR